MTKADPNWYTVAADEATARLDVDPASGLTSEDVERRQATYGANELTAEPQPSVWAVYLLQLKDPMNIMLLVVGVASFFIDQVPVGIMVSALVVLNTVLGGKQELQARASVDALAKMQVPQAKVLRDGRSAQVAATELVPGDIVSVEAGDLVPADGRLLRVATLETQEAALTGESAPVSKEAAASRPTRSRSATRPTSSSRTRR